MLLPKLNIDPARGLRKDVPSGDSSFAGGTVNLDFSPVGTGFPFAFEDEKGENSSSPVF
jgi:hypothetical protein